MLEGQNEELAGLFPCPCGIDAYTFDKKMSIEFHTEEEGELNDMTTT